MAALEKSVDKVVHEFRKVSEKELKLLVNDFTSEGYTIEQIKEPDGTYTVRAILHPQRRGVASTS